MVSPDTITKSFYTTMSFIGAFICYNWLSSLRSPFGITIFLSGIVFFGVMAFFIKELRAKLIGLIKK